MSREEVMKKNKVNEDIKINNPFFRYVSNGGKGGYPVVIFEKNYYKKPTEDQIKVYLSSKKIVEKLGGRMNCMEHEIAGIDTPFTKEELKLFKSLIVNKFRKFKIRETWNGTYSFSISIKRKAS